MKEFNISMEQIKIQQRKRRMYAMPVTVLALIVGCFIGFYKTGYNGDLLFIILPMVVITISIAVILGVKLGNKMNREIFTSYKIELMEHSIRRYQKNTAIIEIERSEITSISEKVNKGLAIKTDNKNKYIDIPVYVEGYSDIKESLSHWKSITTSEAKRNPQLIPIIAGIGVVLGVSIVMLCNFSYIVIPVGIVMILALIWSIITTQRNPNIDSKTKKICWIVILPMIWILARVLSFISIN